MKNKKLIVIVLAFVLLLGGAAILYRFLAGDTGGTLAPPITESSPNTTESPEDSGEAPEETQRPTIKAPDFTVYDADGNQAKLSDYFGKPIVLNFWASWCSPCKSEMPEFNEVYLERGDEIQFLMVNMTTSQRESFAKAKKYVDDAGYAFPVLYDTESSAYLAYGVYSLPTTYFLNAEGNLVTYAKGAIDKETLLYAISLISE